MVTQGELKIGDEWSAIQIIAQSQSHPLKSVSELIENAIDAKAKNVVIEFNKKNTKLIIKDDGEGFPLNKKGIPDVEGTPQRIGDSIKKKISEQKKKGVHGQFGIGVLGFWSLSENFIVLTKNVSTDRWYLRLTANEKKVEYGQASKSYINTLPISNKDDMFLNPEHGTSIILYSLNEDIVKYRLTPEKLSNFLSEDLRNRLQSVNLTISYYQGNKIKSLSVKPLLFSGIPILNKTIRFQTFTPIKIDIYLLSSHESDIQPVIISKDGTKVTNISNLEEFNHEPWSKSKLTGSIDWTDISVAPTRIDIIKDEKFYQFISKIREIEPELIEGIKEEEKKQSQNIEKKILSLIQKAFSKALMELDDYVWFPSEAKGEVPGTKPEPETGPEPPPPPEPTETENLKVGILSSVKIKPTYANAFYNVSKKFSVKAFDKDGNEISVSDIQFEWGTFNNLGTISLSEKNAISFTPRSKEEIESIINNQITGSVTETIKVIATQKQIKAYSESTVFIGAEKKNPNAQFPPIDFEPDYIGKWRSKWDDNLKQILINSAHSDYLQAHKRGQKYYTYYISKLCAKELVLINFKEIRQDVLLERLIEIEQQLESEII